jgi:hypothetical protein
VTLRGEVTGWRRFWRKRVFRGAGIMIEVIVARGNDPAQVEHL